MFCYFLLLLGYWNYINTYLISRVHLFFFFLIVGFYLFIWVCYMLLALGIIWLLGLNGLWSVLGFGFVNSSGLTAVPFFFFVFFFLSFLISNDTTSHYFTLLFFS
ncbi:hypothetical protein I3842_05G134000 [Carya illinoinensis]|uniref:Uncharacterized protein n=1 Tax=Carya illinoinensis TaxID=32201 RepID=A0A922F2I4_CARIL|nr:hypothetical protein I3842_05G134000 [Carya illinoinensis]